MEEYEKFCEKSLSRIQEASLSTESFLPVQSESISLIRFHGVAVLSPLLNIEKRKEMQQEKQKALDVEARRQVNRKKALLTRVQEILENVQVRKAPNASDFHQWETETVYSNSEVRNLNVPATLPNILPSPTEQSTLAKFEKITGILPLNNEDRFKSNVIDLARDSEELSYLKQCDSSNISQAVNEASLKTSSTAAQETLLFPTNEEQDPSLLEEVTPDPYIMSLQNLMKKSKEYIEREQSRRSLRSSVKSSVNESLSDKENDAVKVTDSGREKSQLIGKHCGSVIPDKPSLNKSNVLLQGAFTQASSMNTSVLGNFSKVDISIRPGHSTVLETDSNFQGIPTFVTENNVIRSLTGSYAKIPSPEPSLSPKMHRRRSRPSSACHILINNPINASELSPKGKEQAVELVVQETDEKTNVPEMVPKLPVDLAAVCSSKVYVSKNTEAIQEMVLGKSNQVSQPSGNQLENKVFHGLAHTEGQLISDVRGLHRMDSTCTAGERLHEPYATRECVLNQNFGTVSGVKSTNVLEKNCNLQMELNKSYDVKNPSPLLMQNQNTRQQMDTPTVSCGKEQFLENSFEKVKRRLDLDIDNLQKENYPYVVTTGIAEQERQHLPEKRYSKGSVYIKNKMLESSSKDEEILKSKMLAFEEMRKRLEQQHAQQLSLLIAEQEREQERLQKDIEEQEKMLKEKTVITAEASELDISNAVDLDWRKISDSGLLDTVLSQVDSLHTSNSDSSGFTSSALQHSFGSANEVPFYLWGSSTSGLTKLSVTRPFGRAKTKWSQVFSPEVQAKFNKVTAVAKGFLTRRLMQTDKLKQLRQTVKLRAALYGIHDIFFVMDAAERMSILHHDREVRKEKMLRQMDKMKSPRVALSAATQKSLDRKKYMKAAEMGMPSKKFLVKQNPSETRVLQPNQGQNAPVHRLLSRQGSICRKNPKKAAKCCDNLRRQHSLG
ncbi:centriolar coiled-coil protein of 110 kDa isoform X7 [Ovis aries]|uniref:centriolar coiled-coil protein of 110 kDa isoform X7 n=1 Tax=Ovis aries TaxID=9940 RepID=UPI0029528F54|nr:centriolar coiled-coil protein of 110 kDa isoform X7 [Ovis aries]XP_060261752.1 centriolar coiled-coil protein of 110 kDa isoform X7 [Ovis aries]XP_060261753.1 centriolar coiled-coil protein of 110 kDa isoform X7 [Ovis aries]